MHFNIFRATRPKKQEFYYQNKKTTYTPGQSISKIIKTTPFEDLEKLVADHFEEILEHSKYNEWHYFKMYPKWEKLFIKNRIIAYNSADCIDDFEIILDNFSALESDVYDYLFEVCVIQKKGELYGVIDIAEDILQPMAHLERYRGCYFPQVRTHVEEILSATSIYYAEFYNAIAILEYEFDISKEQMNPYIEEIISFEVNKWTKNKFSTYYDEIFTLCTFFCNKDAYDAFMKKLSDILQIHGLRLYSELIKNVGPIYEIMEKEFDCNEFNIE